MARETAWKHRIIAVIPIESRDTAQAAHTLHWPEGDTERLTFSIPLSVTGQEPATHYATHTSATDALWAAMQDLAYSGLTWYRLDRNETQLLETNSAMAAIGGPWRLRDALDDLGLKRIEAENGI